MKPFHSHHGFTLIELMITVAIIGILAAIAYPSFSESVRRSRRSDAQTTILEAQQYMQRYYSAHNNYGGASLPAGLAYSPKGADATSATYTLAVAVDSDNSGYTITATPAATDAKCGNLTLTDVGVKGYSGSASELRECWS